MSRFNNSLAAPAALLLAALTACSGGSNTAMNMGVQTPAPDPAPEPAPGPPPSPNPSPGVIAEEDIETTPLVNRVSGDVRLAGGVALAGASIRLLDDEGTVLATTTTDISGAYSVETTRPVVVVTARQTFVDGSEATAARRMDLRDSTRAATIVLPNLPANRLSKRGATASGSGVTVDNLPDAVAQIWAAPYLPSDRALLPGRASTLLAPFDSAGVIWFSAADAAGNDLTSFPSGLRVQWVLDDSQREFLADFAPGNGQIDPGIASYDPSRDLWEQEGNGVLLNAAGNPVPETALAAVQDGSAPGPFTLAFTATHFSAYATYSDFLRTLNCCDDFGNDGINPTMRHVVRRGDASDFDLTLQQRLTLGSGVSTEAIPREPDSADGLLACGQELVVALERRTGRDRTPLTGYLQVMSAGATFVDTDGNTNGAVGFEGYQDEQWVVRNLRIDNWVPGIDDPSTPRSSALLQIDRAVVRVPASFMDGQVRLMVTPVQIASIEQGLVFQAGETEDYTDTCSTNVQVDISGDTNAVIAVDGRADCTAGEACDYRVGFGDSLTLNAQRAGLPQDVEWSRYFGSRDPGGNFNCPPGPTCEISAQPSGVLELGGYIVAADFPLDPRLRVSISGTGRVQDTLNRIDCDTRPSDNGASVSARCEASFAPESLLTLTASGGAQSEFVRWDGVPCAEGSNTGSTCSLSSSADAVEYVTAVFADFPVLTVQASGAGTVTEPGGQISCREDGGDCSLRQASGTSVTLDAIPDTDGRFFGWGGLCEAEPTNRCTFTLSEDATVGANFVPAARIEVVADGQGRIVSNPAGLDCGVGSANDCSDTFTVGLPLDLTATPQPDHSFVMWDDACAGQFETCTFDVDQPRTITATFAELFDLAVVVTGSGGDVDGPAIFGCEASEAGTEPCIAELVDGTQGTFTANAFQGNLFAGWGGACAAAGTMPSCTISIDQDTEVLAEFAEQVQQFTLTLTVDGTPGDAGDFNEFLVCDNTSSPCQQDYANGTQVMLFGSPGTASHSFSWGGDCTGTADGADCTLTINGPADVSVTFFDPNAGSSDPTLSIDFIGAGNGVVTDDSGAISCSSGDPAFGCSASYAAGSTITLNAGPQSMDDVFIQWQGQNDCAANDPFNPDCTLTLTADTTVTAEFDSQGGGGGGGAMQLAANPPLQRTNDSAGSSLGVAIGFDSGTGQELVELVEHPNADEVIEVRPVDDTTAQVFIHQPSGFTLISPAEGTALDESNRQTVLLENTFGTVYQLSFDLLLDNGGDTLTLSNQDGFNCGPSAADCP